MGGVENAGLRAIFSERKFRRNVLNCKIKQGRGSALFKQLAEASQKTPVSLSQRWQPP